MSLPIAQPLTLRTRASSLSQAEDKALPTLGGNILGGLRILVVDDEPDSRELVATILKRCGGEVRCSQSAADAIRAFKEWQPDLLISDIAMPHEDGFILLEKLRKLRSKRAKEIPAVALSAYASDEDRSLALSKGFQLHLPKPIEPEHLVTSIAAALGRETS